MWVTVALKANHGVTRLKRFVSRFSTKLCNLFIFLSTFNIPFMCQRFDRMDEKFLGGELNRA